MVWSGVFGLVLMLGSAGAWKYIASLPPTPQSSRNTVSAYLKKKTGWSNFASFIDLSQEKNPWSLLKAQYETANDYKSIYRLLGEHLSICEKMLRSSDAKQQEKALRLLVELCQTSEDLAVDGWLAARICDGYLTPNLSKVEAAEQDKLIHFANRVYVAANEKDRTVDIYKMLLASTSPEKRSDQIRFRLADLLTTKGDYKEALLYFRQIKDTKLASNARQRIATVEQKLKRKG